MTRRRESRKRDWKSIMTALREVLAQYGLPSVSQIAALNADPFRVLVSTVISLRTKDEVTIHASERLLSLAPDPASLLALDEDAVARLIYPAGFYRTKAKNLVRIAAILMERHGGKVPPDRDILLSFPGVGRKTANLVLNLGFGIDAICVDTHVHRVSNRTGWVTTSTPEETEYALMEILMQEYWIEINELLVRYGQNVCTPVSPRCSLCGITEECERRGVTTSR